MFEFSLARKYLIPRRRHLSISLIALMSVIVISCVVWLMLLFLSITGGIEMRWLHKLTSLNGQVRITPTESYYNSYYHLVDSYAAASGYKTKSLSEKLESSSTDPYDPSIDEELPGFLPPPSDLNIVQRAAGVLNSIQDGKWQDFEMSGAMLRLRLIRHQGGKPDQTFLSQATYLASFGPHFDEILEPNVDDLNQLLYQMPYDTLAVEDTPERLERKNARSMQSDRLKLISGLKLDLVRLKAPLTKEFLSEDCTYRASGKILYDRLASVTLGEGNGVLSFQSGKWVLDENAKSYVLDDRPIYTDQLFKATGSEHLQLKSENLAGYASIDQVEIVSGSALNEGENLPWIHKEGGKWVLPNGGVLLPRQFRDSGVHIGDEGYIAFTAASSTRMQEQRIPIQVAGFYDPGVFSIGSRSILLDKELVRAVAANSHSLQLDPQFSTGFQLWHPWSTDARVVAKEIQQGFNEAGIGEYFTVMPYHEFPFAKDLLSQFQSDKYLFTLVGLIILIVACSNIITLLLLLVNDKKREIGILQAMGASRRSIAFIFGSCGAFLGLVAGTLGILGAYITLQNIDSLVALLSSLQGRDAFNATFYGTSLPSELSRTATLFAIIATPILSVLAALVPALKASRLSPSQILRSE